MKIKNTFARYCDRSIKALARMVGFCLTNPDEVSANQLAWYLRCVMQPGQRKFVAVGAMLSLTASEYEAVIRFLEGE